VTTSTDFCKPRRIGAVGGEYVYADHHEWRQRFRNDGPTGLLLDDGYYCIFCRVWVGVDAS
jgi:hypothetical protein